MPYANNITRLTELAAQAYLRSKDLPGVDAVGILAGFDDGEVVAPRIVCDCSQAEADSTNHPDDGIWACTLEVQVISDCDTTTKEDHHDRTGLVFSQFMAGRQPTETADAISAAFPGFQCQQIFPTAQIKRIDDRKWISSLILRLICNGIDM